MLPIVRDMPKRVDVRIAPRKGDWLLCVSVTYRKGDWLLCVNVTYRKGV